MSVRSVVERLARSRVVRRALPTDCGGSRIYVSPDSKLAYLFRSLERADADLFSWVRGFVREGSVVWDIGANCGVFAFAAAGRAGRAGEVVAVEPDPWLVNLLRRSENVQRETAAKVEILPVAVSAVCGEATLFVAKRGRASNWIELGVPSTQAGGFREERRVATVSLDSLLADRMVPDVVKIDVEGAEIAILDGATRLLEESRPILLLEVSKDHWSEVSARLRKAEFDLFDAASQMGRRIPAVEHVDNVLAIPR